MLQNFSGGRRSRTGDRVNEFSLPKKADRILLRELHTLSAFENEVALKSDRVVRAIAHVDVRRGTSGCLRRFWLVRIVGNYRVGKSQRARFWHFRWFESIDGNDIFPFVSHLNNEVFVGTLNYQVGTFVRGLQGAPQTVDS